MASCRNWGVEVQDADFDQPESLVRAVAGADQSLVVSASGIEHQRRATQHRNYIEGARHTNVGHGFYTSLIREPTGNIMTIGRGSRRGQAESGAHWI